MLVTLVGGARPNWPKIAPIVRELARRKIDHRIVHTGQHLRDNVLGHTNALDVYDELELPPPDLQLRISENLGAGSHAHQTADVMTRVEDYLRSHRPDWLVVVGDVNSTLGAALAAVKLGVKVAHVEAGYRSFDWTMPEEVNRVLVDHMSDLLLCPDDFTSQFLTIGKPGRRLHVVGNVMMDSLRWALPRATWSVPTLDPLFDILRGENGGRYALLTAHRPANVDSDEGWQRVERAIAECPHPIVWPGHHRSEGRRNAMPTNQQVIKLPPQSYLSTVALLRDCAAVITDSGGLYEEALYLDKPIISLRDPRKFERAHLTSVPEIWKTDAAPRIVDALLERS